MEGLSQQFFVLSIKAVASMLNHDLVSTSSDLFFHWYMLAFDLMEDNCACLFSTSLMGTPFVHMQSEEDITVSIRDVAFVNNLAINPGAEARASGGAVKLWRRGSNLNLLSKVTFMSNVAQSTGGAVFMNSGAALNMTDATFSNNSATSGGAVFIQVGLCIVWTCE